jgi:DNA polymerase
MLVGEQPGDQEDKAGEPFVGPAGHVLDRALADAGIDRADVYVTNAVKHFKWKPRGKRRLHDKPNRREVVACRQWLDAELEVVDPAVIVVLGATAGQALFGAKFRVGAARGQVLDLEGFPVVATVHPSAVLRTEDGPDRDELFDGLVADLRRAAELARASVA